MRFILIIFLLSCTSFCSSQSSDQELIKIRTVDKQVFIGKLINITSDSITIKNESLGNITLAKSNIIIINNDYGLNQNNSSEPFFIPTGIPNGKNNHYYRNYALFGQNFSFGLNDNLDVSFGFELLSVFVNDDAAWPVMQLAAKYSGSISNNFHIGISTKVLFNNDGGGILTSIPITVGGLRTNFTFAPTFSQELGEDNRDFAALYNFNLALSDKVRLVTDGIYTDGTLVATSLIEIRLKSNILLQPGIIYSNDFQIVPNFSFTIPFGAPKGKKI